MTRQPSRRRSTPLAAAVALTLGATFVVATPTPAEAQPWRHMRRHQMGKRRCLGRLMHGHPEMLKKRLQLTDAQIAKIDPIRTNFLRKAIKYRAMVQQYRLDKRTEMRKDLPNQGRVLAAMRKIRGARGNMKEEMVKAYISILKVMNPDQRKKMRQQCRRMGRGMWGPGNGWRRWQHRRWRHQGGPGGGPGGGGGPGKGRRGGCGGGFGGGGGGGAKLQSL